MATIRKVPCVVQDEASGALTTECCNAAPIFFRSNRTICSKCLNHVERGPFSWENAPQYASLSHLDTETKKRTNQMLNGLPTPRTGIAHKRTIKPLEGQTGLWG